jgi:23S rRNA pseudouridine1911/1915/1917 synthase
MGLPEIFEVEEVDAGSRLDLFLALRLGITRSFARKLVDGGHVSLSRAKKVKAGLKLAPGTTVTAVLPPAETMDLEPEDVPFRVVHEDPWLIVIDKPAGIVVHPAPGNWRGTLVHGLLYRFDSFGAFNNVHRPGIVHRLDGPTSGLLVVAKEQAILDALQQQFRNREVEKRYLALVEGRLPHARGRIELPVGRSSENRLRMDVDSGGKSAVTEFRLLWGTNRFSFVECRILTGRTHQIRVHMSHIGHPLVGDKLYGASKEPAERLGRVFLHSWKLSFQHPVSQERASFTCPLPGELTALLRDILSKGRA